MLALKALYQESWEDDAEGPRAAVGRRRTRRIEGRATLRAWADGAVTTLGRYYFLELGGDGAALATQDPKSELALEVRQRIGRAFRLFGHAALYNYRQAAPDHYADYWLLRVTLEAKL